VRAGVLLPLAGAYLLLAALYLWQAWRRETPTIFTDELELTQLARGVAETGSPERRGEPLGFTTLVPYLAAPPWLFKDVTTAYALLKYEQTLVMLSAIFPAYGLARLVVSRPWAVGAAIGAVAAPALSYAPILVEEPFAYPAATLALWLTGRALRSPSWRAFGAAGGAAVLAALTRSQLVALVAVVGLCLLAAAWDTSRARAWRATWSRADWVGLVVLGVGAALAVSALMGRLSGEWAVTTATWRSRILEYGLWAGGAFAVGVGFVPVVATLAALARPRAQYRDPGTRAWVILAASSIGVFAWYAALKGAYLSTLFSSLVVERNLIYLTPIVMAGTALLLERRDTVWWAALAAGAITLWAVVELPKKLDYPYYEAHGLSILALANRLWRWPLERIEHGVVLGVVLATALVLVLGALRRETRLASAFAVALGAAVLGWTLTNQIYAANGEHRFSARFAANLVDPPTWVDDTVGDDSVLLFGQQLNADPTGLWETEFWNRSIDKVWSVDGTAPGPGGTLTPDLASTDGTLSVDPGTDYALVLNGVELQATPVTQIGTTVLYRLAGPFRLRYSQTGVYPDGWMGAEAAYNRFDATAAGTAVVNLSREAFCTDRFVPSGVRVRLGPVAVVDGQPALGAGASEQVVRVRPCEGLAVSLPTPAGPWRVEVESDTFVPAELDPALSERRELGVRVSFGFEPA
jgi:hypothetical protein